MWVLNVALIIYFAIGLIYCIYMFKVLRAPWYTFFVNILFGAPTVVIVIYKALKKQKVVIGR